jgi:heme exporter protein D
MGSFAFFIYLILPAAPIREVDSASTRYEYQEYLLGGKYGRYVGLTTVMCRLSRNPGNLNLLEG